MTKIKTFREDYWQGRRDFLARSAFLFAAMGIAPAARFDLTAKLAKKMGISSSTLMANGLSGVPADQRFMIHWKARSGCAWDQILFPFAAGLAPERMNDGNACENGVPYSRLAYIHRPDEQISLAGSLPGTQVHFTKWAENLAPMVEAGKFGVAYTASASSMNGHTGDYAMARAGGINAPDPAVLMAGEYGGNVSYAGIEWKQNDGNTMNQTGAYAPLQRVGGNTNRSNYSAEFPVMMSQQASNFLNLFSPAVLPFSEEQVGLIASVSKKINENYTARVSHQDPESFTLTARSGADALTLDLKSAFLTPLIQNPDLMNAFQMERNGGAGVNFSVRLGEAMYMMLNAFGHAASRAATITMTTGDWHEYLNDANGNVNSDLDVRRTSRHAGYGEHIAAVIQATFEYAETLPNPFATDGSTIADALTIIGTSEFQRGAIKSNCSNIADQGRDGFMILSKSVNNLAGGNWVPVGNGQTLNFNRQTGISSGNEPRITHGEAYATMARAAGISADKIQAQGVTDAPIFAMLKE